MFLRFFWLKPKLAVIIVENLVFQSLFSPQNPKEFARDTIPDYIQDLLVHHILELPKGNNPQ